jgi:hypothetical protein
MIYDAKKWRLQEACSPLASQLAAEVSAVCGQQVLGSAENVAELARAVDGFLQQEGRQWVDSGHLIVLASQALSALGEQQAARKLSILGTGLVRPSEWTVTGAQSAWVLDLNQMTVRADAALELVFFQALDIVIECIGEVWDESAGKGTLGLRHVCLAAQALLGSAKPDKHSESLAGEIVTACREKLARVGSARGWKRVPQVMNLDL